MMEHENKLIDDSLKITIDTEHLSENVVLEMGKQTEHMGLIANKLNDFNSSVLQSRSIISKIKRCIMTNKLILGVSCILLFGILLSGITYYVITR